MIIVLHPGTKKLIFYSTKIEHEGGKEKNAKIITP
jgi:hypothetical protein